MAISQDPNDPNFGLEMDNTSPNFGLPAEQPKEEGGVLSGIAAGIGRALNPINLIKGALDIGGESDISKIRRYSTALGEIVSGTPQRQALEENIPEVAQQQKAVFGEYGGREQAAALTGIGLQAGLVVAPFIHGRLSEIAFGKPPPVTETPVTDTVAPVAPEVPQVSETPITDAVQPITPEEVIPNASEITSPEGLPVQPLREEMGGETPLRQPGEIAGVQPQEEVATAPQEAVVPTVDQKAGQIWDEMTPDERWNHLADMNPLGVALDRAGTVKVTEQPWSELQGNKEILANTILYPSAENARAAEARLTPETPPVPEAATEVQAPVPETPVEPQPPAAAAPEVAPVSTGQWVDPEKPFISAAVTPSAREPGSWQGTIFGPEGPAQHIEAKTRAEVEKSLSDSGFVLKSEAGARPAPPSEAPVAEATPPPVEPPPETPKLEVQPAEAPKAEVQPTPAKPPPVPVEYSGTDNAAVSRFANRFSQERVASGEIGEIAPGQGYSTQDLVQRGLSMPPEKVADSVSRVMQGADVPVEDAAAIRGEEARLSQRSANLSKIADADPNNVEAKVAADNAFKDLTDFHNGPVATLKNNWANQGRAMQGEIPVDLSSFNGMREAWLRDTGEAPPLEMEPKLRAMADKVSTSMSDENGAMTKLGQQIDQVTSKRKLPNADDVVNNIMERMKNNPCRI